MIFKSAPALCSNFDISLTHISSEKINITLSNDIIKPGYVLCINKNGMKRITKYSDVEYGNLYIIFDIEYPNVLTDDQHTILSNVSGYVPNKKSKNKQLDYEFTNVENLQTLLNTDDEEIDDNSKESVQCVHQ